MLPSFWFEHDCQLRRQEVDGRAGLAISVLEAEVKQDLRQRSPALVQARTSP